MYDKYLDKFMPSFEMREYLKTPRRSVDSIADIIYFSPVSLDQKYEGLCTLRKEIENDGNDELEGNCDIYIKAIEKALEIIEAEGVFTIELCCAGGKNQSGESFFEGVYAKYSDVMEYMQNDFELDENGDNNCRWYEIKKWVKNNQGKYFDACSYYIVRGKIYFIQVDDDILDDYRLSIYNGENLNIPVPFKAGDIVETDGYPFAPKSYLLILEVGDNLDCCCLQALHLDVEKKWDTGAVKHGHIGIDVHPMISALYNMRTYDGELQEDIRIFREVQQYIGGNEEKGAKLWNKLSFRSGISTDELRSYISE